MKGFDCFSTVWPEMAPQLSALGYSFFARYYRRAPLEGGRGNALSRAEAAALFDAGFWALAIYQNYSDSLSYFSHRSAEADAAAALAAARYHGQPKDTAIYFAVDFNPTPEEMPDILAYFQVVQDALWLEGYLTGVYGSGMVCRTLVDHGVVHKTWLSNAKGWRGYYDWFSKADVVQTTLPFTLPFGLEIDGDECLRAAAAGLWRPAQPEQMPRVTSPQPSPEGFWARFGRIISSYLGRPK